MNTKSRGFTLIEMMMVIMIVAILAGVGAPAMNKMAANSKSDRVYQELELDLRYARSQASTTGRVIAFEPITNWQGGWKITDTVSNSVLRERKHDLTAGEITSADIATGAPLNFAPSGRTSSDASVVIKISGCSGLRVRTLLINRIGQIQLTGATACP